MITIKNEFVTAKFNTRGAELKSFMLGDVEYVWNGTREPFWKNSCPMLFPICSGLKDDFYYLEGEKYPMQKHGYIRFEEFEVEDQKEDGITFLSRSNEETLKCYPFTYELRVIYKLEGKKLNITYNVKNLSDDTMYFSIGGHDGFDCPEGIEDYEVILPQKETLYSLQTTDGVLNGEKICVLENSNTLPLRYADYQTEAIILDDMKSRSMILRNVKTDRKLKIEFEGFDYFLIWTQAKLKAPFVCLETWKGICDDPDTTHNIEVKRGIETIEKGGEFFASRSIEILN